MCLTLGIWPFNRIRTAKEDIVCYKTLQISGNGRYLETPYMYEIVKIGETYKSKLYKENRTIEIGLHSFKEKKSAIKESYIANSDVIVKCIIPKGSQYYKGKFSNSVSYASNMLKYVEILKQ